MDTMSEEITEQQAEQLLRSFSESKQTIHSFFTNVIKAKDTTKMGYLNEEELGTPHLPVRSYKELSLFSDKVAGDDTWANYFKDLSEIQTSTSLSKDAMLLKLSVTQKKELADVSPRDKKKNRGWFKKDKSDTTPGLG